MKKALIVSTVGRQFYLFENLNIEVLKELGYEVHGAANLDDKNPRLNDLDIKLHHFKIQRSPFSLLNIHAFCQLRKIIKNERFDLVHCHSPMGGVLGRLAAKSLRIKPIIYTAHGFHFFKGASAIAWCFYYPIEYLLSKLTDVLITINKEDFSFAKKHLSSEVVFIPGIGVDQNKFDLNVEETRISKREELGISPDAIVVISVGELIERKNYITAIKVIERLKDENVVFLICGVGKLDEHLKEIVKNHKLIDKIKFLGYRNDIPELCLSSDIFFFPSLQEGLPVALMEAMSSSLPVVCSSIRGNVDLIDDGVGGYLCKPNDVEIFSKRITSLINNINLRKSMGNSNKEKSKYFSVQNVRSKVHKVYSKFV